MTQTDSTAEIPGATVVISHRIRPDKHDDYETWLGKIAPLAHAAEGNLDWHIVRPVGGLTDTYTVIIRFDTADNLKAWMASPTRQRLVAELKPLLATDDQYTISSGLDFWFAPSTPAPAVPPRWKQFLLTWSAIFPLATVVPLVVLPAMRVVGVPDMYLLNNLVVTAVIVLLMVYLVMPRYTALVRRWLY